MNSRQGKISNEVSTDGRFSFRNRGVEVTVSAAVLSTMTVFLVIGIGRGAFDDQIPILPVVSVWFLGGLIVGRYWILASFLLPPLVALGMGNGPISSEFPFWASMGVVGLAVCFPSVAVGVVTGRTVRGRPILWGG